MAKKKAVKKAAPVKRARQAKLAGMEDDRIDSLENAALDYAAVRDKRIAISAEEVPLKKELLNKMKALKREHYKRDGIEITLVHEDETVKVRVKKPEEDDSPEI